MAVIELIGQSGSLGSWVVSDWISDPSMVAALKEVTRNKSTRTWQKKLQGNLARRNPLSLTTRNLLSACARSEHIIHFR